MYKHERVALRRQLDGIYAGAETFYEIVKEIVAAAPYSVPAKHHEHIADITGELLRVAPGLCGDVVLLRELGEPDAARAAVADALAALRTTDPHLYDGAPSVRLLARLTVGGDCDADVWASAIGSADYCTADDRRRRALRIKRRLREQGLPVPTEDDVTRLPGRDEARAEESRNGGGVRASARLAPKAAS